MSDGADPAPDSGRPARGAQRVDKYFGTKLPPVCSRLGCYLTDDGKRFYCINPSCHKDKKRSTKHTRVNRAKKQHEVFFRCPKCNDRHVDMDFETGGYLCRTCSHRWDPRKGDEPQS